MSKHQVDRVQVGSHLVEGVRCSDCGMSYKKCTTRILEKGLPACCTTCYEDDSHATKVVTATDVTRRSFNERWGFVWEGVRVARLTSIRGRKVLSVDTGKDNIEIIVSPQHHRVQIWKNGKEQGDVRRDPQDPAGSD